MRVVLALALLGAPGLGAGIRFEEIAERAGLRFVLENDASEEKRYIETMPGGVAAFDYDRDGLADIFFFANGARIATLRKESPRCFNRLFRNLGGLKFRDDTEEAGLAEKAIRSGRRRRLTMATTATRICSSPESTATSSTAAPARAASRTSPLRPALPAAAGPSPPPGWITTTTAASICSW
jgi:hypothetical protein